jgi:hypothetical protein
MKTIKVEAVYLMEYDIFEDALMPGARAIAAPLLQNNGV